MANWPTPHLSAGSVRRIAILLWQRCGPTRPASNRTGRDLPRPGRGPDHDQDESYVEAGRVDRAGQKMRAAVQKNDRRLGRLSNGETTAQIPKTSACRGSSPSSYHYIVNGDRAEGHLQPRPVRGFLLLAVYRWAPNRRQVPALVSWSSAPADQRG